MLQLEEESHSPSCIRTIRLGRLRASLYASNGHYRDATARLESMLSATVGEDRIVQRVHLHQALAYTTGMVGDYEQAISHVNSSQELLKSAGLLVDSSERMVFSLSMLYTSAFLDMLQGNYDDGYHRSSFVLEKCRHAHGAKSLCALRSSVLYASFLVHLGQFDEAATLCTSTMRTTQQRLGRGHPLHLEAASVLVRVLRATYRLPEALATAKTLFTIATESLTTSHPLILETCGELAAVYLALGMFHSASRVSETVLVADPGITQYPEGQGLRHLARHAEILHYCGESQKALDLATSTLRRQWHQFTKSDVEDDPTSVLVILDEMVRAQSRAHLELLATLHIIAVIKLRLKGGAQESVDILRRVLQIRTPLIGGEHSVTIQTGHDLASAIYSLGDQSATQLDNADYSFQRAWESRCHLFGLCHPSTLAAERAVIQSRCKQGVWETGGPGRRLYSLGENGGKAYRNHHHDFAGEPDSFPGTCGYLNISMGQLRNALEVSQCIFLQQEELLGPRHPDTLTTMRWLVTIQMHLYGATNFRTKSTWQRLRAQLHDDETRREGLAWALRMEHSIAVAFSAMGQDDAARVIWRDIREIITGMPSEMRAGRSAGGAATSTRTSDFATSFSVAAALRAVLAEIGDLMIRGVSRSGSSSQDQRAGCHEPDAFRDSGIFM